MTMLDLDSSPPRRPLPAPPGPRGQALAPALLLLGALLPALGCASSPWRREVIFKSAGIALYKEHRVEEGSEERRVPLGYAHPIDLPVEKAVILLSRLAYVEEHVFTKDRGAYVFDDEREIPKLAEPLSVAVRSLGPDERLRFFVARSSWSDMLKGTAATSGVLFSTVPGELDVALDWILERVSLPEEGRLEKMTFRLEPTEVTDASPLLPSEGLRAKVDPATGRAYPRWVEARIDELKPFEPVAAAAPLPTGAPPVAIPGIARPPLAGQGPSSAPTWPAEPAAKPAVARPAEPPAATESAEVGEAKVQVSAPPKASPATAPAPAGAGGPDARYQHVRERVETLKRLRADGVLSEAEFQAELRRALEGS